MTISDKIRNEKLKYGIRRASAKISGNRDNYEYLAGEEILPLSSIGYYNRLNSLIHLF